MNAIIRFDDPKEFLQELQQDRDSLKIEDNIIRITRMIIPLRHLPTASDVFVVCTYKTKNNIVRLKAWCGDTFGEEHEEKAEKSSHECAKKVEDKAKELKLNIRAGLFEFPEEK